MTNKKLIIIFAALLGVYLLSRLFTGNRESTFDPEVVKVDTALITEVHLYPKAEENTQIILRRTTDGWTATKGDQTVKTPFNKVQGLLGQLSEITSQRIVSKSKEKWAEYEVDDKGSRVQVFNNKKQLADFIVGTFKFDQARRSASSYLRRMDEDAVYLVDGFMSMSFNQGFNTFRNNELIKLNQEDIREVAVLEGSQKIAISKNPEDGLWYRGGMEKLDSTKSAQYISQLTNIYGSDYVDTPIIGNPIKSLEISGNNLLTPLRVDCYAQPDTAKPFVLHASSNPEAWFSSDSAGIYQRIFKKFDELLYVQ
ncbi:MAG TPA: DUF4340 domain-containing protein [Saprospiraceae bacterium]|nr:DUF4340 domain-containing protein [Saprospiraceae bacterium]